MIEEANSYLDEQKFEQVLHILKKERKTYQVSRAQKFSFSAFIFFINLSIFCFSIL